MTGVFSHNYSPYVNNSFEMRRLREQIKIAPAGVRVIEMMDELSDILCSVVDLSEFVRNTHPDPLYVQVHISPPSPPRFKCGHCSVLCTN
jgi:hypothetical protein